MRQARTKNALMDPMRNPIMRVIYWILFAVFSNFWNRDAPEPSEWYEPDWPEWMRWVGWWLRNPNQDFRAYIIGVTDKDYEVIQWGESQGNFKWGGWHCHHLKYRTRFRFNLRLPFISYQSNADNNGMVTQFYVGWMEIGRFGYKLRKHNPLSER